LKKNKEIREYVSALLEMAFRKKALKIVPSARGARTVSDFPPNTYIVVKKTGKKMFRIFYAYKDEDGDLRETNKYDYNQYPGFDSPVGRRDEKRYSAGKRPFPKGYIIIEKKTKDEGTKIGKCGDAWSIQNIQANKGWGPLLYDIAMEFLTRTISAGDPSKKGGLMADRLTVSSDAAPVWDYYQNKRKDPSIKSYQMDDLDGTLKKLSKTDPQYKQYRRLKAGDKCNQSGLNSNWIENPRSKRWTKDPIVLNELEKLQLIHYI
jgi:hypothetical protein